MCRGSHPIKEGGLVLTHDPGDSHGDVLLIFVFSLHCPAMDPAGRGQPAAPRVPEASSVSGSVKLPVSLAH